MEAEQAQSIRDVEEVEIQVFRDDLRGRGPVSSARFVGSEKCSRK